MLRRQVFNDALWISEDRKNHEGINIGYLALCKTHYQLRKRKGENRFEQEFLMQLENIKIKYIHRNNIGIKSLN